LFLADFRQFERGFSQKSLSLILPILRESANLSAFHQREKNIIVPE